MKKEEHLKKFRQHTKNTFIKTFLFLVTTILLFCLTSCSVSTEKKEKSNFGSSGSGSVSVSKKTSDVSDVFNADTILENLETIKTYTWNDSYHYYMALIVKNNSSLNCRLDAKVTFKNTNGEMIGVSDDSIDAFEAGSEICLIFSNEDEFASFDYEYDVSKLRDYDCVSSMLSCETSITSNKAIIAITNNGEKAAEFVKYRILFMQGDEVIDSGWGYATDSDSEIKPGKTITEEETFYNDKKDFDNVKVYYTGQSEKN